MGRNLIPLSCHLKMVRMMNFMLCIFHQQGKWERVVQAGVGGDLWR